MMPDPLGSGPTTTSDPAGIAGDAYGTRVATELEELYRRATRPLTVTGTNALTATTPAGSVPIATLTEGMTLDFVPPNTNTGAMTLAVDGLSAIALVSEDGNALTAGQVRGGRPLRARIHSDGKARAIAGLAVSGAATKTAVLINKRTNASGGGLTSGSDQTFSINTKPVDTIGISGTLPEFTLPAGAWDIDFTAVVEGVGVADLRLWNVTDNALVTTFFGVGSRTVTTNHTGMMTGRGRVTPATSKTYKFVTRVQSTNGTDGQGGLSEGGGYFTTADLINAVAVITEARSALGGPQGQAATLSIGTVTTLDPDDPATVTNGGTSGAAVLNFGIPRGAAGTIEIGDVTTVDHDEPAAVTDSGAPGAAVLDFSLPRGIPGPQGLNWQGPWSAGAYAQFDAVSKGTASYVANTATSQEPPGSDWDLLVPAGPAGPAGIRAGLRYTFDSSTGVSNPGTGKFRITSSGNAGFVISNTPAGGGSIDALLNGYAFVDNDPVGIIIVQSSDPSGSVFYLAEIIFLDTGGSGWSHLAVSQLSGSLPANGADCVITFLFRGSNGTRVSPPATATSSGSTGEWAVDANYFYACVANNTWRRVALSSW
ncbi:hypothetical protein SAMN02983003_3183 [Devosia enhydra]|uniref:Uncharacterized protein n=1 Tax=Devosia enhydra TaxID=665118 RepID=A0A1K2I1B6_9HYPH|nr:hypothetical protein [Devosia enhydra]SFZ86011.1 hypothetical protein SAMN02983003_3183 [Devosia enhydra]